MDDLILSSKGKGKIAADGAVDGRLALFTAYSLSVKSSAQLPATAIAAGILWPNILKLKVLTSSMI